MTKSFKSVSSRLSKKILLITNAIFVTAIIAVSFISVSAIKKEADANADKSLDNAILNIEKILVDVESATESVSWMVTDIDASNEFLATASGKLLESDTCMVSCAIAFEPKMADGKSTYFLIFSYIDPQTGEIVQKFLGSEDYDYHTADWYQIPKLTGKDYWSEPTFDAEGTGKMVASFCKPLFDLSGTFIGVMRSDVELEWLTQKVQDLKPFKSSFTMLVGRNGMFISHPDSESIMNETLFTHAIATGNEKEMEVCMNMLSGENGSVDFKYGNHGAYGTYAPLRNGWSAILVCIMDEMYASANRINMSLLLIVLIGLLIIYFSSKKIISDVTMPLTEFSYAARNIGMGFFNARLPQIDTNDEVHQLRDSLRYVQKSITQYIEELKITTSSNERIESELNIASAIQQHMVSHNFPQNDLVDIYAMIDPAKEVGGDLYDFERRDNLLYFAVGDVSGKGVPAAMLMAITKSAFRFVSGLGIGVAGVASKINNALSDGNETMMFVTMFIAKVHLDEMYMEFCNLGHNPLVLVHADGTAEFIQAKPNIAAGLFPDFPFVTEKLQLEKGCRIIAYTDGITEAETRKKDQFGEERLLDFASHLDPKSTSKEVSDNLLARVREFTDGNEQNDDITIMTITF